MSLCVCFFQVVSGPPKKKLTMEELKARIAARRQERTELEKADAINREKVCKILSALELTYFLDILHFVRLGFETSAVTQISESWPFVSVSFIFLFYSFDIFSRRGEKWVK